MWINNEIDYDVSSDNDLDFCQKQSIKKYVNYGPIEIIVTVPKSYKSYWICVEYNRLKSECLFLHLKGLINTKIK